MFEPTSAATASRRPSPFRVTAIATVVLSILLALAAGAVEAKTIVCTYATECTGTKRDDTIRGEGQNNLYGKGGDDLITTAGASVVVGAAGDDEVRAFGGSNIIKTGPGNDLIKAANGEADNIDCGPGKDRVVYDAGMDQLKNCEDKRPR